MSASDLRQAIKEFLEEKQGHATLEEVSDWAQSSASSFGRADLRSELLWMEARGILSIGPFNKVTLSTPTTSR